MKMKTPPSAVTCTVFDIWGAKKHADRFALGNDEQVSSVAKAVMHGKDEPG